MTARRLAWLAVFLAWGLAARGEEAPPRLTLGDCERLALKNSAAAANARRDEKIADARVTQARAEALPALSATADYTRLDETQSIELEGVSVETGSLDNYSGGMQLDQVLYSGGRVKAAIRAARVSGSLASASRREAEAAVVRDVRTGFHDVLLARAAMAVRAESVAQREALAAMIDQKFRQGTTSEYDALSARVRVANEKPLYIRAVNVHELGMEQLRRQLGLGAGAFELAGELQDADLRVDLKRLQQLALETRPALQEAAAMVLLREQDALASRSGALPRLRGHGNYRGGNSYSLAAFSDDWEWHWTAGLSMEWDVWDGGLTRGTMTEKRLVLEKSRTDLEDLRKQVLLEVRQAVLDLQAAREAIAAGAGNEDVARKALEIANARYRAGLGTQLELADAQAALNAARLIRLDALRDRSNAVARLRFACGTDDLAAAPAQGAAAKTPLPQGQGGGGGGGGGDDER